jgi:hypothetical protein
MISAAKATPFASGMLFEPLAGTYRPFADTASRHPVSRRTLAAAEKLIDLRSWPEVAGKSHAS